MRAAKSVSLDINLIQYIESSLGERESFSAWVEAACQARKMAAETSVAEEIPPAPGKTGPVKYGQRQRQRGT